LFAVYVHHCYGLSLKSCTSACLSVVSTLLVIHAIYASSAAVLDGSYTIAVSSY
jgi:hypothetical protein